MRALQRPRRYCRAGIHAIVVSFVTPLPPGATVRQLVGNRDPRVVSGLAALGERDNRDAWRDVLSAEKEREALAAIGAQRSGASPAATGVRS